MSVRKKKKDILINKREIEEWREKSTSPSCNLFHSNPLQRQTEHFLFRYSTTAVARIQLDELFVPSQLASMLLWSIYTQF